MKKLSQPILIFCGSIAIIAIIILVSVLFSQQTIPITREKIYVDFVPREFGGKNLNDYIRISDMIPNSMAWFYYPDSKNIQNRDAYQKFLLIRLPEDLGGNKNDTSAFRAYSALSINAHCLSKYWPQEGRKRIEDPCGGDMILPLDGILGVNSNPVNSGILVAQPYLKLSSDSQGFLYVEPPVWQMDKNGVVGIGRKITQDELKNAALGDLQNYIKQTGRELQIPLVLSNGYIITPGIDSHQFIYKNIQDARESYGLVLSFCNCSGPGPNSARGSNIEHTWGLGKERLYTDQWTKKESGFEYSTVTFYKNGYELLFSGQNLEKTLDVVFDNFYPGKNRSMLEDK